MLYKRSKKPGGNWWVKFTIGGSETRVSSGTNSKAAAEEFERKLREQVWREKQLGEVIYTWEDATAEWIKDKAGKRSLDRDLEAFAALSPKLSGMALADIDKATVRECEQYLASTPITKGKQQCLRASATVTRMMAVLRSVLNRAVKEWEWLTHAPRTSMPR